MTAAVTLCKITLRWMSVDLTYDSKGSPNPILMVPINSDSDWPKLRIFKDFSKTKSHNKDFFDKFYYANVPKIYHIYAKTCHWLAFKKLNLIDQVFFQFLQKKIRILVKSIIYDISYQSIIKPAFIKNKDFSMTFFKSMRFENI